MIPKIIHYCWFGGNKKQNIAKNCIKSWKKHCKDYKIIEWNESNFDISSAPAYVKQAYEAKKWAFVTDYVRLYAMVTYGGIYMDTDVEVIKSLDEFLVHEAFSGFEDDIHIPTGIMASEKDFPLFKDLLSYYDTASFINADGSYNMQTNVTTITNTCLKFGLKQNGKLQTINGFTLYPKDYFCPLSYRSRKLDKSKNTACIHWFNGSWLSKEEKAKLCQKNRKERILKAPNRLFKMLLGNEKYDKIKCFFKG